jgi:hypothetical protein
MFLYTDCFCPVNDFVRREAVHIRALRVKLIKMVHFFYVSEPNGRHPMKLWFRADSQNGRTKLKFNLMVSADQLHAHRRSHDRTEKAK